MVLGSLGVAGAAAGGCGVVTANASAFGGSPSGFIDASAGEGSSGGDDAAASCRPSNALVFTAGDYRAAMAPSDACVGADGGEGWEDFYDACLGTNKSTVGCATYKAASAANAACAACVVTPYSADQPGPILDYGQYVGGNVAGCFELTDPADPTCPKAVQALSECELAACQANCPVSDPTSLSARDACAAEADTTVCSSLYAMAETCRLNEADAGQGSACSLAAFKDFYDAVVPLFCGQQAVDGGAAQEPPDGDFSDGGRDAGREDARASDAGAADAPAD
jgi:hypothetical protein